MKYRKILGSPAGMMAIVSISIAGANIIGEYTIEQRVVMDTVDISVSEKMHSNNDELVDFSFNDYIVPTQEVEKLTSVKNKGSKCFVRFKIEVYSDKEKIRDIRSNEIIHLNDSIVYCNDEYFYLNDSLKENEEINIFDGLIMPEKELHMIKDDEKNENKNINFVMTVDSIQTRGFEQDLTANNPWKGVSVQKIVKTRMEGI